MYDVWNAAVLPIFVSFDPVHGHVLEEFMGLEFLPSDGPLSQLKLLSAVSYVQEL